MPKPKKKPVKKKPAKKKAGKTKPVESRATTKWGRKAKPIDRAELEHSWGREGEPAKALLGPATVKRISDIGWGKAKKQARKAKRTKESWKKALMRSRAKSGSSSTQVTWDGDN